MFRVFMISLLGCCLLGTIQAEDWPQWRGANRDGVWSEEGITDLLPEGQLPLDWSVEIGAGYSGPTVANGRVYVMDRMVDNTQQTERVLCFDSKTGKEIWKHQYEAAYGDVGYAAGPRASVTIDNGMAFAVGTTGHFHCFDAASGRIIWKRDLNVDYDIQMPMWGIAGSPLVYGELVIQQISGSEGACIVAFDKASGKEVWRALEDRAGYSSPVVIQQAGQDVLVCWTGDSLTGLDPRSGKVAWSHALPSKKMPIGIGTPSIDGEQVFVSSFYDGSLMIRADRQSVSSQLIWRAIGPSEQRTGATSVQLADSVQNDGGVFGMHAMIGTPIVDGDYIYGVDSYGEFRCLDSKTGKRIWEDLTAVPRERWATIHMVRQADRVWMFSERGELLLTKLSPQGLEILGRSNLIEPTSVQGPTRGDVCWSHPAFAEKSIFARNDEKLVRASLAKTQ